MTAKGREAARPPEETGGRDLISHHQPKPLPFSEFLCTCFTLLSLRTRFPASLLPSFCGGTSPSQGLPTNVQKALQCGCPGERIGLAQLGHMANPGPINSGRGGATPCRHGSSWQKSGGLGSGATHPSDGIPSSHFVPCKPLLLLDSQSEKPYSCPHSTLT